MSGVDPEGLCGPDVDGGVVVEGGVGGLYVHLGEDGLPGFGVWFADVYFLGVEDPVEKGVEVAGARVLRSDVVGVDLVAVAEQCDEVSLASELSDLLERVVPESEEHGVPGVAYLVVGGLDVACSSDGLVELLGCYLSVAVEGEVAGGGVAVAEGAVEVGHSEFLECCECESDVDGVEYVAEVEDVEFFVGEDFDWHRGEWFCVALFFDSESEEVLVEVVLSDYLGREACFLGFGGESAGVGVEPPEGL